MRNPQPFVVNSATVMLVAFVAVVLLDARARCANPPAVPKASATNILPADPWPAMKSQLATLFCLSNMTRLYAERALESGDKEVFAAAVYNELHLAAVSTNDARAEPALRRLETEGDDFTLTWLETAAKNESLSGRRALLDSTRERIQQRSAKSLLPPEKLVRERLLNAAVSDLTCSQLEGPLKGFMWRWGQTNALLPAVRAELTRLQSEPLNTNNPTTSVIIRQRVNWYATRLLEPPASQP